ncbi:MAG: STAS domain-containing protein [Thermodesulfobacteriota bacterium]|nr:STAS domain-containing protein [Thermodesulfobacteriota bacterium]
MIEILKEDEQTTVKPGDKIVASMAQEFRKELLSLIEEGNKGLVVDMADVMMIDSIGIGILVATHNSLSKNGGGLTVMNVSQDIYRLFKTMRLDQYLTVKMCND